MGTLEESIDEEEYLVADKEQFFNEVFAWKKQPSYTQDTKCGITDDEEDSMHPVLKTAWCPVAAMDGRTCRAEVF